MALAPERIAAIQGHVQANVIALVGASNRLGAQLDGDVLAGHTGRRPAQNMVERQIDVVGRAVQGDRIGAIQRLDHVLHAVGRLG